jgi:hypothetical protein
LALILISYLRSTIFWRYAPLRHPPSFARGVGTILHRAVL